MSNMTPMMQQYLNIKEKHKDCIVFFRLGDFYEMFFKDAEIASKELEITLTGRDCGLKERAPMCGVPFHSADAYISKLISKGYKIAICEQVEDVSQAKGIVKRDVVRIVTPGTVTDSAMLDEKKNNFLMCILKDRFSFGIAVVDLSTGEFNTTSITSGNTYNKIVDEIAKFSPVEIITNDAFTEDPILKNEVEKRFNIFISLLDSNSFNYSEALSVIKLKNCDFNEEDFDDLSIKTSGALLGYLNETQKANLEHIREINSYKTEQFMVLDVSTRRNLELTETMREKSKKGTLLWVLDRTMTFMGARKIRKWIEQPLLNITDIDERLHSVSELKEKFMVRMEMREHLKKIFDIERLMSRIVMGNANCRDLISLKNSISRIPLIKEVLKNLDQELNKRIFKRMDNLDDIYELIEKSIEDEPPVTIKEGGIIKSDYSEDVKTLREASVEGKNWIASLEKEERIKTKIKNLKVGFNKVFGYYIEVTKSYFDLVPQNYVRKQTLSNCERYITDELKKVENKILGAQEKLVSLEYEIFVKVRDKIAGETKRIIETADSIAEIDSLCSFAETADRENYCCPELTLAGEIEIIDGRHPVVEKMLEDNSFVPNNTVLDTEENRLLIITGPNMAGKSTYMRQTALIVLLAQTGCFVPAKSAKIGIVDRIFTRVGASDDLSAGQSTFMVEMNEVANIVSNATKRSLLVLDEIGRGTSTFDGLSIAWAVIEFINDIEKIGARTLFATHYHELTELEDKITGIKNYCISIKEKGDDIIFLRKIIRGGADGSYGIQVAKLAGIPDVVIQRAKEILTELEDADISKKESRHRRGMTPLSGQMDLFSAREVSKSVPEVVNRLKNLDVTTLTPIEALNVINELQKLARDD